MPGKTTPNDDLYTSASLSLVLSDLLSLPEAISFAKIRAGYSQVAGGADNPYTLSLAYGIYGQGHEGASLGRVNNGSISPESNISMYFKPRYHDRACTRAWKYCITELREEEK